MRWQELTTPELEQAAAAGALVVLPIGAIEQHGPHLAVSTDAVCAENLALATAARAALPVPVLVAPTVAFGYSDDHMGFVGTLSLSPRVLEDVLVELGTSILSSGFERLLLLNGHGSNDRLLYYAIRRIRAEARRPAALAATTYWKLAGAALGELRRSQTGGMGHACELETSLLLHFAPGLVHMEHALREVPVPYSAERGADLLASGAVVAPDRIVERTASGVMGDPTLASAEQGERFAAAIVDRLHAFLLEFAKWPLSPGGTG